MFGPLEQTFVLLIDKENKYIAEEIGVENSGPHASFEIITWIIQDVCDAATNGYLNDGEANQMRALVLDFRTTIAKIFVTSSLPNPFYYVYFFALLKAAYLPLFATIMAFQTGTEEPIIWSAEMVSILVVVLQSSFIIGLRTLEQHLSDPYGDDLIDLQVACCD